MKKYVEHEKDPVVHDRDEILEATGTTTSSTTRESCSVNPLKDPETFEINS